MKMWLVVAVSIDKGYEPGDACLEVEEVCRVEGAGFEAAHKAALAELRKKDRSWFYGEPKVFLIPYDKYEVDYAPVVKENREAEQAENARRREAQEKADYERLRKKFGGKG